MLQSSTSAALIQRSFDQTRKSYRVLTLLLILVLAGVGTWKGRELTGMMQAISQNEAKVNELQRGLDEAQKIYTDSRTKYVADLSEFDGKMNKVIPAGEAYTDLTRSLDLYFERNFSANNPIVASGLRYGKGQAVKNSSFFLLPTSLTITSSKDNFFKFLRYIEDSGSLENSVRFMEVDSIRVNFSEGKESVEDVSFTVDLKAYYRDLAAGAG